MKLEDLDDEDLDDFEKAEKLGLKIGILDIETTGLDATFNYVVCACIRNPITGVTLTLRIDDPRNPNPQSDRWLIREIVRAMDSFDIIVGWNSSQFDIPFINARAFKFGQRFARRNYRRDLLFVSKANFRMLSHKLGNVEKFLTGRTDKTEITPALWVAVIRGDTKAVNFYVDHCQKDVKITEKIYRKMLPLISKRLRKI